MKFPLQGLRVEALKWFATSTLQRFSAVAFFFIFAAHAHAQLPVADRSVARSVSGQFIINAPPQGRPLAYRYYYREVLANTNLVQLEPALLAVSTERFKTLVWEQLGLEAGPTWRGKIFLTLSPAQSLNDDVVITSAAMSRAWEYHVNLPDVVTRTRYARALANVLLLEIANRNNPLNGHAIELPPWLGDGLAQAALDEDVGKVILSAPTRIVNGVTISRIDEKQNGLDPLTSARATLQNDSALTFDQISWPTSDQQNGADGGVYLASAQLFVHDLLNLRNGAGKMRALLAQLPRCLNWQTAFFAAFQQDFQRPSEVEKWWALRVVNFAAHNVGTQWTLASSNDELAERLAVPVAIRNSSNSFPVHAEFSLQDAIRSFSPEQCDEVLSARLRDLELAQFRVATPFAALTSGYCAALADFLGDRRKIPRASARNASFNFAGAPGGRTSLDALKKQAAGYQDVNSIIAQYMAELRKNPQLGIVSQTKASAQPPAIAQAKPVTITKPANNDAFKKPPARPVVTARNYSEDVANNSQISGPKNPPSVPMLKRASAKDTLKKLDDLDAHRRELLARLNLNFTPRNLASATR